MAVFAWPTGLASDAGLEPQIAPWVRAADALAALSPAARQRWTDLVDAEGERPGRHVIHLTAETDPVAFARAHGLRPERVFTHALKGLVARLDESAIQTLRALPEVLGIMEDAPVAEIAAQTIPAGFARMGLEPLLAAEAPGADIAVDVAVLDSGIQLDHPDLNVHRWVSIQSSYEVSDHATAVAGIIGALDNNHGTLGMAPGVKLWAIDASKNGLFSYANLLAGFDYVAAHAAEITVLNCSFGGFSTQLRSAYETAVRSCVDLGVVVVCAAGNNSRDIAGANGLLDDGPVTDNFLPAALPESMAVSAANPAFDTLATYSNFSTGNHAERRVFSPGAAIDVAAPTEVFTTLANNRYGLFNGTSAAAPHVSGLIARHIAKHGRAHDAQGVYRIRQAIVDAALPQSEWLARETRDPDDNPEGLAVVPPSWLGLEPRITRIEKFTDRVELEFVSQAGSRHALEHATELAGSPGWVRGEFLPGTGHPLIFTHHTGELRQFYRIATHLGPAPRFHPIREPNRGLAGTAADAWLHLVTRPDGGLPGDVPGGKFMLQNTAQQGGSGGMQVPWLSEIAEAAEFTIELWAKPARTIPGNSYAPKFAASLEPGGRGWSLNQYPATDSLDPNGLSFVVRTGGTGLAVASAQLPLSTDEWYHLAGVCDLSGVRLYLNGVLLDSATFPVGQSYQPPQQTGLCFGSDHGHSWFEGRLDEIAFYPFALSPAQIQTHHQAGISPDTTDTYRSVILADKPVAYWNFDE